MSPHDRLTEFTPGNEVALAMLQREHEREVTDLRAQIADLKTDADRYRWLRLWKERSIETARLNLPSAPWVVRAEFDRGTPVAAGCAGAELDAAIDLLMESSNG